MFKISVIGNLGSDAEIKNDNGRQFVQFSVADTRRFAKADGTKEEVTNWISCFMRNPDAEVIKYLKKGTKVWVSGYGDLRIFSSKKDRAMKAGASINVIEIELVGGSSEDVPRELALPSGQLVPVYKAYYIDIRTINERPQFLFDKSGKMYDCNANGFVWPSKEETQESKGDDAQQDDAPFTGKDDDASQDDAPFTGEDNESVQKMANTKNNGKRK